jgi:flagellar motor switch/type III secretory pathway protein FliN
MNVSSLCILDEQLLTIGSIINVEKIIDEYVNIMLNNEEIQQNDSKIYIHVNGLASQIQLI